MEDVQKIVDRLRPIDDIFFQKLAENKGFCEELLQVIMNDKGLKRIKSEPQKSLRNVAGRSVTLDVLCKTLEFVIPPNEGLQILQFFYHTGMMFLILSFCVITDSNQKNFITITS